MNVLIVDDEEVLQDILTLLIRKEGHHPLSAMSGEEGLAVLEREEVDLVLLDLMLPGISGQQVLRRIRQRDPEQVVIVITAFSSIESAIDAMREGAFHYIPKPFKNEEVLLTVRKALEQRRLTAENRSLKEQLRQRFAFDNIIGKSKPMQQVYELIQLAAPSKSNIMVLGESGTGKELVAKAIHHHSRRSGGPFIFSSRFASCDGTSSSALATSVLSATSSRMIESGVGRGASTSRTMRSISKSAALPRLFLSSGVVPVSSSYSSTPSE